LNNNVVNVSSFTTDVDGATYTYTYGFNLDSFEANSFTMVANVTLNIMEHRENLIIGGGEAFGSVALETDLKTDEYDITYQNGIDNNITIGYFTMITLRASSILGYATSYWKVTEEADIEKLEATSDLYEFTHAIIKGSNTSIRIYHIYERLTELHIDIAAIRYLNQNNISQTLEFGEYNGTNNSGGNTYYGFINVKDGNNVIGGIRITTEVTTSSYSSGISRVTCHDDKIVYEIYMHSKVNIYYDTAVNENYVFNNFTITDASNVSIGASNYNSSSSAYTFEGSKYYYNTTSKSLSISPATGTAFTDEVIQITTKYNRYQTVYLLNYNSTESAKSNGKINIGTQSSASVSYTNSHYAEYRFYEGQNIHINAITGDVGSGVESDKLFRFGYYTGAYEDVESAWSDLVENASESYLFLTNYPPNPVNGGMGNNGHYAYTEYATMMVRNTNKIYVAIFKSAYKLNVAVSVLQDKDKDSDPDVYALVATDDTGKAKIAHSLYGEISIEDKYLYSDNTRMVDIKYPIHYKVADGYVFDGLVVYRVDPNNNIVQEIYPELTYDESNGYYYIKPTQVKEMGSMYENDLYYITIKLEKIINILVKTTDVVYKNLYTVNNGLFDVYMALSDTPMASSDFTDKDLITYNSSKGGYPLSGIQGQHMYIRVDLNREVNEVDAYYYRFLQVLYSAINLEQEGGYNLTINNDVNIIFDSITFDLILKTTSDFYSYDVQC
ncbi:MAG: hypothetical protein IJW28_00555, partial [Clostridia bacterium]|nr:hypothetical protein [Clostridia bacterium]